jgi:transcriptional regulator with XRE-family HTH domain
MDAAANPIRVARRRRGLSATEVARRVGVSRNTLWRWETGRAGPSGRHLLALAEALEEHPEALLGGQPLATVTRAGPRSCQPGHDGGTDAAAPRPPSSDEARELDLAMGSCGNSGVWSTIDGARRRRGR